MDPITEVFNDGVLKAELLPAGMVCLQWITNDRGYLQKTVVKDLRAVERLIVENGWKAWAMASEVENVVMHKIIEKVGGVRVNKDDRYVYFKKEFLCAER